MKAGIKKAKKYYPLFLSLVIPGLGQLVKGQWKKTLFILVAALLIIYGVNFLMWFAYDVSDNIFIPLYYVLQGYIAFVVLYLWQLLDVCVNTLGMFKKHRKGDYLIKPMILSFLLPGVGQLVKRQIIKGLLIMVAGPIIIATFSFLLPSLMGYGALSFVVYFLVLGIGCAFYMWQVFDAEKVQKKARETKVTQRFPRFRWNV